MICKNDINDIYGLSPMQEGMLFHHIMDSNSTQYVEQANFDINGDLDLEIFEKAFNGVIKKYDILRTIFVFGNGKRPLQGVLKKRETKIFYNSICGLSDNAKEQYLHEFSNNDIKRGFDLKKEILMRVSVIKIADKNYKVFWTFHHIIMDGWCLGIIIKDFLSFYNEFKKGNDVKYRFDKQYSEYIKWLKTKDKDEAIWYWKDYIKDYNFVARIPEDKIHNLNDYVQGKYEFTIDEKIANSLKELSMKNQITLSSIFQSIWGILLSKYNNVQDVVFGSVVSGRPNEIYDVEKIVGLFINTLPVRIKYNEDDSFIQLVKKIQDKSIEALKYNYISLADIQANSKMKNELINNICIFENYPIENLKKEISDSIGFSISGKINFIERTNYNLELVIIPGKDIKVKLRYNISVYTEYIVSRIADQILYMLQQISDQSDIKVKKISLIKDSEKSRLLYKFNNVSKNQDFGLIHKIFESQVEKKPDNVALVYKDKSMTYEQLNQRSNQLARLLKEEYNVEHGDVVGICLNRSIESIICTLSILKLGAICLHINPKFPLKKIKSILSDCNPKVIFNDGNEFDDKIFDERNINIRNINLSKYTKNNLNNNYNSDDTAYLIYTSGSTGKSKGVMINHKGIINHAYTKIYETKMMDDDICCHNLSFNFVASIWLIFSPFFIGAKIHLYDDSIIYDSYKLFLSVENDNVSILEVVPSLLKSFLELPKDNLDKIKMKTLKKIILTGEKVTCNLVNKFYSNYNIQLLNAYGQSECSDDTLHYLIPYDKETQCVPIGKPSMNTQVYIMNDYGDLQPIGICGEIYIGGVCIANGYLNNTELTKERFVTNPFMQNSKLYRTGDLGRWLPNGSIEFLGRKDNQVKIRGFRIELEEIENVLLNCPTIKEVVVVNKVDKNESEYLCAYITSDKKLDLREIREFLSSNLPSYMIPSFFVQIEKMPLNQNGKIDRAMIIKMEGDLLKTTEREPARNKLDEKLIAIWQEVLQVNDIGINDDFFELGGHSLKATVIIGKIYKEVNVEVPLREIFSLKTIKAISDYIESKEEKSYMEIKKIDEKEEYEVSSAQNRMYIAQQFDKRGTYYNISQAVCIEGCFEREKVESTFLKLIQRHESLRTSFKSNNDRLVQIVHNFDQIEFSLHEIIIEKLEDIEDKIKEFCKSFDLGKVPLLRVGFIKVEDEKHILVIDIHHIICDGSSIGILIKEFVEIYEEKEQNNLKIQYKDFASWQNQLYSAAGFKKEEDYWLKKLSGNIPVLNIPTDYKRPDVIKYKGSTIPFKLDRNLSNDLKLLSKETNSTLYMILLSAINILLHKYSNQDDIIIGSPIAGRNHTDLNNVVGMFVNTLVMRNFPEKNKTFYEFLKEVKENTLQAFENQNLQFEELVTKLNIPRLVNRNPLFNVSFAFENMYMPIFKGSSTRLKTSPYKITKNTSKFDLTFFAFENLEGIEFLLEYSTELYNESTIKDMIDCLKNILIQITKKPQIQISQINMLTKEDEKKLTINLNKTCAQFPSNKTIHKLIEEQVNRTPDEIAIIFDDKKITYRELNEKANRLANFLVDKIELKPNELVGILMDKSDDAIVSILGVLKAGGAYIPIETDWPQERIKTIIDESKAKVVISGKKYIKILNNLQWECRNFKYYICMDCNDVYSVEEGQNQLMNEELWQYIGENSIDDIKAGEWRSSYTGDKFSTLEMEEHANNILIKLKPYLNSKAKVLEIGCTSGSPMFKIAPIVGQYYGTGLSQIIMSRNKQKILNENINNIRLQCIPPHEIDKINEDNFNIVILNSVVQSFHGYNYLRDTIKKIISLMSGKGIIFFADIMDKDLQSDLIKSLMDFKSINENKDYNTKTDFSSELFLSKGYFKDLEYDIDEISCVNISDKIYTIENELTKYRYDVILEINKQKRNNITQKLKYQYGLDILLDYETSFDQVKDNVDDLCYVIYTSGSTGKPKGVMITHHGVVNYVWWASKTYTKGERLKFPLYSSLAFDLTVTSIFTPLITGGSIIVYNSEGNFCDKALIILNILEENTIDIIKLTPGHLKLIENNDFSKSNLKRLIVGGDQLTTKLARKIYSCFGERVEIFNEYGPTEATVGCMIYKFNKEKDNGEVVPIGVPVDNFQVFLLDNMLKPVPRGVDGQIYISGVGVSRGYLNDYKLTDQHFINNPFIPGAIMYKTGDLAKRLADNNMEFLGRIDHQVKINGYRIEIAEIEHHILENPNISEAVVIDKFNDDGEKNICAYFVGNEICTIENVREHLKIKIPDYMIPSHFIKVDKIPLNSNGKLDRRALPDPTREIISESYFKSPRNDIEKKLINIWEDILGINNIGIYDNFFKLGGHSLKAAIMVGRIYRELNEEIPLRQIFKGGTVAEISEYISQSKVKHMYKEIKKIEEKDFYETSSAQKRMYLMQQFNNESIIYNIPNAIEIVGKLEMNKINDTFLKLIERHESLRTSFQCDNNHIVQKVHKMESIEFKVEELKVQDEWEINKKVKSFITSFDLSKAPLLRCGIIKLEEERHLMIFDIHHIISDGVSMSILIKEFGEIYGGKNLDRLVIQYKDYAAWQNEMLTKEEFKKQEKYWLEEFEGEIPRLNMPTDYERSELQSFNGDSISFRIKKEEADKLRELAKHTDTTMFMVLLSALNILFAKCSGQCDILIGTVIAGRNHPDLESIIGMFVNTLIIRSKLDLEIKYEDYLNQIKGKSLKAYENQDYQFNDLVEKLNFKRELNRNLLFDIMFVMQNVKVDKVAVKDLVFKEYKLDIKTSKFDILITAAEVGDEIMIIFEYCTELYKKETISKMIKYFKNILNQITYNKNIKLSDVSILSKDELKILTDNINDDIENSTHYIEFNF